MDMSMGMSIGIGMVCANSLLVSALHAALSLRKGHDIAMGISQHLDLDVVGVLDEPANTQP